MQPNLIDNKKDNKPPDRYDKVLKEAAEKSANMHIVLELAKKAINNCDKQTRTYLRLVIEILINPSPEKIADNFKSYASLNNAQTRHAANLLNLLNYRFGDSWTADLFDNFTDELSDKKELEICLTRIWNRIKRICDLKKEDLFDDKKTEDLLDEKKTENLFDYDPLVSLIWSSPGSEVRFEQENFRSNYLETIVNAEKLKILPNLTDSQATEFEEKLANKIGKLNEFANRLQADYLSSKLSFEAVLEQIIELGGVYKEDQARLTELIVHGYGNCEARSRLFTAMIHKIFDDIVFVSRYKTCNKNGGDIHVVTTVDSILGCYKLDGSVIAMTKHEVRTIKQRSPLEDDYQAIIHGLKLKVNINHSDRFTDNVDAQSYKTNSLITINGEVNIIDEERPPRRNASIHKIWYINNQKAYATKDIIEANYNHSALPTVPIVATLCIMLSMLITQVLEKNADYEIKPESKSAVKPVDIKLEHEITPPSPSYDTVQTDPKR